MEPASEVDIEIKSEGSCNQREEPIRVITSELLKIVQENISLKCENNALKEALKESTEFQKETKKNFAIMQTQLDEIIELLHNKNQDSSSNVNGVFSSSEYCIDKMNIGDVTFPIATKGQLDELEYKLLEKDVMNYLVKYFSETCGTSGIAKISKIGLTLMKCLIKDELLNQFSWKGIKGTTKMGFVQYVKIRELFYRIAHVADKSCSFSDSDTFLQHSAIKHSGQRLKRQMLSSECKMNGKKMKNLNTSKIDEDRNYCGFKNKKASTDKNCRYVSEENTDSNTEKLQVSDDDDE